LLEKIKDNPINEVFPCLWTKQVFPAERLVGSLEKVYCLLMGQDPPYVETPYQGVSLRATADIAFYRLVYTAVKCAPSDAHVNHF